MDSLTLCPLNESNPELRGYLLFNQNVSVFDFGNVIVAKNYKDIHRVRLLSGGTVSLIDYVGKGMLTASVQGSNQDLPTPAVILRTIRELCVNHNGGLVIIVPFFSTDILSFGLATERAINDDLQVMLLGIADDCRNSILPNAEKRGLSGIVLVNKIAGALAELGQPVSVIHNYCSKVITSLTSISTHVQNMLAFEKCKECYKCKNKIEKIKIPNKSITTDILANIARGLVYELMNNPKFSFCPGDNCVILINNIAALKRNEEYILISEIDSVLKTYEINVIRLYIGEYLYINNDIDLSITLLKVFDNKVLSYLDAPCSAPGWKPVNQFVESLSESLTPGSLKRKCRLSPPIKGPKLRDRPSNVVRLCLQFACDALISCEKMLNIIDSEKGDGDTGSRLKNVAEVLLKRGCSEKLIFVYPFTFFLSMSKLLENAVGGTLGCIYSILFEAAAKKFADYKEDDEVSYKIWVEALENAVNAFERYGNVKMGEKTMFDPLAACIETLKENLNETNPIEALGRGVAVAEEIAAKTVKPGGKYPDAGAHAVGIWMRAVYEGIKLRC